MKAWLWEKGEPKRVAEFAKKWIPQALVAGPWLVRIGAYLQAIGRECYHQCDHEKQCAIDGKLEKVYGPHKT